MSSGLRGWSEKDLKYFLKAHGFDLSYQIPGSHQKWFNEKEEKTVEVNTAHGYSSYPIKTLKGMIQASGYTSEYAINWKKMDKKQQKKIAKEIKNKNT